MFMVVEELKCFMIVRFMVYWKVKNLVFLQFVKKKKEIEICLSYCYYFYIVQVYCYFDINERNKILEVMYSIVDMLGFMYMYLYM